MVDNGSIIDAVIVLAIVLVILLAIDKRRPRREKEKPRGEWWNKGK